MKTLVILVISLVVFGLSAAPVPLPNLGNTCYMNAVLQNLLNLEPLNSFLLTMKDKYGGTLIPAYVELAREKSKADIKNDTLKKFYVAVDTVMLRMSFVRWIHDLAHLGTVDKIIIKEQLTLKEDQLQEELTILKERINKKVAGAQEKYDTVDAIISFLKQELTNIKKITRDEVSYDFFINLEDRFVNKASKISYRQEDASEFYLGFVDALLDLNVVTSEAYTYLSKLLQGSLTTIFSSKKLNQKIQKTEPITVLTVPIEQHDAITDCIADVFKTKDIGTADIQGSVADDVQEQVVFAALPEVLILQLNRYDAYGNKITQARTLPFSLSLYNYVDPSHKINKTDADFSLIGIVLHHGGGTGSGHYTTYIQDVVKGGWYVCDDSSIVSIGSSFSSQVGYDETTMAYLLFYMRTTTLERIRKAQTIRKEIVQAQDQLAQALADLVK